MDSALAQQRATPLEHGRGTEGGVSGLMLRRVPRETEPSKGRQSHTVTPQTVFFAWVDASRSSTGKLHSLLQDYLFTWAERDRMRPEVLEVERFIQRIGERRGWRKSRNPWGQLGSQAWSFGLASDIRNGVIDLRIEDLLECSGARSRKTGSGYRWSQRGII